MILKERIDRPKLCFRVIRPRIIFRRVRDQFYFVSFHFNPFFLFISFSFFIFLLGFFSSIVALFFSTYISRRGELNNFGTSFFYLCFPASGIWSLIARKEISLRLCPPMWRVILGRDIEGNLSGSKGVTRDNFSISVKGWWNGHFSSQT